MQPPIEDHGEGRSNRRTWVHAGLLTAAFFAGILCALGSGDGKHTAATRPIWRTPQQASAKDIEQVQKDIAELQQDIADTRRQLAEESNPEVREVLANSLTYNQRSLEYKQTWLQQVKAARDTGSCFPAGMWVLTADGAKPIDRVRVGDRVLSRDAAGRQVSAEVLETYKDTNRHYYLINGRIKVTALHRFFTDKGWKRANGLAKGDRVQTAAGGFEEITDIAWVAVDDLPVFNLTIAENHNFFVSPDGRNGYLVHNTGGGGGGGGGGSK